MTDFYDRFDAVGSATSTETVGNGNNCLFISHDNQKVDTGRHGGGDFLDDHRLE